MKVLVITSLYPDRAQPTHGIHNARLVRHLAQTHDVRLIIVRTRLLGCSKSEFFPCKEDEELQPAVGQVRYIPKIGSLVNHRLFGHDIGPLLAATLDEFSPDVILAPWLFPDGCGVVRALGSVGVPVVMVAQGTDVHHYLKMRPRRKAILEAVRIAGGTATRSKDIAEHLVAAGAPADRVRAIYNGVDLSQFSMEGCARRDKELLYVGNFYDVKNPLLAIRALAVLQSRVPDSEWTLTMIGDGPLQSTARTLAADFEVAERVVFAGRLGPEAVAAKMRDAEMLLIPSRNEGIPNVLREAFACGTPAVATRVGGIPEILCDARLGELVPTDDAEGMADGIEKVLGRCLDRDWIRAHAQQYSWAETVEAYSSLFEDAIRKTPTVS